MWRQDTSKAAQPRAKLSRRSLRWALEGIVCQHLSVARVAEGLGVSWNTANTAVLAEGKRVLIEDPHRFDGVKVSGVDEHVWRHTRGGDKYVTVIIDLTPIRDGTEPVAPFSSVASAPDSSVVDKIFRNHEIASDTAPSANRGYMPRPRGYGDHRGPREPTGYLLLVVTVTC